MAAAFRPVNTHLAPDAKNVDIMTTSPATPRINAAPLSHQHHEPQRPPVDDSTTPTRASFGNTALSSQRPLPSSPFPEAVQVPESADQAKPLLSDRHSRKSRDSADVDMDDSDGETAAGDDGGVSDDDSNNGDGSRSGKKKKSQRFYCTDYPPCNLSFTRSEHLARHIRKHTGERPFQCHCSRRFSRLDNLRQHAQTVHVNEGIPMDSLAATGARFQRQIRTDRVRQVGGRARASTAGSGNGPVRGHSKSLSTSSIGSVSSVGSYANPREDMRRRPPPLVMADPRARPSLDGYRPAEYMYRPVSPSDFSTPTSATFSTGQSSPRWGSAIVSPTTSHSRSQSMYSAGVRTPGRRLSVPSTSANPFQSPHSAPVNRPIFGPGAANASNAGAYSPATSSILGSPTTPSSAWSARRDSTSSAADEAWRRRTWHPESRGFQPNQAGGGHLTNITAPVPYQPGPPLSTANPSTANQSSSVRLPGIESFDPLPPRPTSPPRRAPSPMMVDSEATNHPALLPSDDRRGVPHWDMGLHRGLTRLDIRNNITPPRDSAGAWANEANRAVQAQAEQARVNPPTVRFDIDPAPPAANPPPSAYSRGGNHQYTMSAPSISTPRDSKRHGWYHGPAAIREQPMGQPAPDNRGPHVDRMVHPNMNAFSGFPNREAPRDAQAPNHPNTSPQQGGERPGNANSSRFDALVAVAASEGSTATAY